MADDHALPRSSPPEALAEEVRRLKALLLEVQAELRPAIQSSLRERSTELQRIGGELHEQQAEAERLKRALEEALERQAELEREATRWREAATRGLKEISERSRAAQARFDAQIVELNQTIDILRDQLGASRSEAQTATAALDTALATAERATRRAGSLKARVLRVEAWRIEVEGSAAWWIAAPVRRLERAWRRLMLSGARLRRRLIKR